ncbi:MAG: PilZ domain-containing protein [Pseudomonadaceae bacterium]|nr:PilZ domain-containing protein [Pseudomonadaceae bacterium]
MKTRYPTDGLVVSVRKKGGLLHLKGLATDFNRHGIALLLNQALGKDSKVFISLGLGEIQIHNVVGIVHNCVALKDGYRCGIQFRTASNQQTEQTQTNQCLQKLEEQFIAAASAAS